MHESSIFGSCNLEVFSLVFTEVILLYEIVKLVL
jgi:hypothetical protein